MRFTDEAGKKDGVSIFWLQQIPMITAIPPLPQPPPATQMPDHDSPTDSRMPRRP